MKLLNREKKTKKYCLKQIKYKWEENNTKVKSAASDRLTSISWSFSVDEISEWVNENWGDKNERIEVENEVETKKNVNCGLIGSC